MAADLDETKAKLETWLRAKMPDARDLRLTDLQKPGMGLSSETYLFDIQWKEGGTPKSKGAVLRAAPRDEKVFPEYHLGHQFRIMEILKQTDVPVATMLWLEEDPAVIGAPFFLMEKLEGDVPQDYPSYHGSGMYFEATPETRAKMWWGSLQAMADIHKLDWRKLGLGFLGVPRSPASAVDRQLDYWERYLNGWLKRTPDDSYPIFETSLAWLKEHRYEAKRVTLCWGDARIGNTLYSRPDRDVLAVMDWEMAFIGDPEGDLAWFLMLDKQHSKGYGLPPLEGTPSDEAVVERYEKLMGWRVENFFYNEVLATLRYGMTVVAVLKKLKRQGIPIQEDYVQNNFATQHLAELLGLPAPGTRRELTGKLEEITVSVQFHFTGPGGYDCYLISDRGKASRHEGTIAEPNCTLTVSLEDWKAMQRGELNQLDAWSSGRLVTEGDLALLSLLRETIAELSPQ